MPEAATSDKHSRSWASRWRQFGLGGAGLPESVLALGAVGGLGWAAAQGSDSLWQAVPVVLAGGCIGGLLLYCR